MTHPFPPPTYPLSPFVSARRHQSEGIELKDGSRLKVGAGKPREVRRDVESAVRRKGATRHIFFGNVDDKLT